MAPVTAPGKKVKTLETDLYDPKQLLKARHLNLYEQLSDYWRNRQDEQENGRLTQGELLSAIANEGDMNHFFFLEKTRSYLQGILEPGNSKEDYGNFLMPIAQDLFPKSLTSPTMSSASASAMVQMMVVLWFNVLMAPPASWTGSTWNVLACI